MAAGLFPFSDDPSYEAWAGCGVGSTVTSEDVSEMTMDQGCLRNVTIHTSTLKAIDDLQATVEVEIRGAVNGAALETRQTLRIPAPLDLGEPDAPPSEDSALTMMSFADLFRNAPATEGTEVLEVAGKPLSCRWVERTATMHGQEIRAKFWLSPEVPGGVVKSEARMGAGHVTKTTVTSFEKKGPSAP